MIFDAMFLPNYSGPRVPFRYVPLTEDEGAQLLANLFKNAQFISLLRSTGCQIEGPTARLADALLMASLRIAGFLVQDVLAGGLDVPSHMGTLDYIREYCLGGGLAAVRPSGSHALDGMFLVRYGLSLGRKDRLRGLFRDKYQLAQVALAFLAIFESFLVDPDYCIDGIGEIEGASCRIENLHQGG